MVLAAAFAAGTLLLTSAKPVRVVVLALDGIRVDGLQQANTPNLDAIFAEGASSTVTRDQMPSITLVNFTSHLTGSGPEQHGVVSNKWKLDNIQLPPVVTDEDGYYPGIFKMLKDNVPGVKTGFYWNWQALINTHNQKYIDDLQFLKEEHQAYGENYDKCFEFLKENKDKPAMVFMYNVTTDHIGHKIGWMTPEYIAAIEESDSLIGTFVAKLKDAGMYDSTYIFFITDHGGVGTHHGKVSQEEMIIPWAVKGPTVKKGYEITSPHYTTCTAVDIMHIFKLDKKIPPYWIGKPTKEAFKK